MNDDTTETARKTLSEDLFSSKSKPELLVMAREADVSGRSSMTKQDLADSIAARMTDIISASAPIEVPPLPSQVAPPPEGSGNGFFGQKQRARKKVKTTRRKAGKSARKARRKNR